MFFKKEKRKIVGIDNINDNNKDKIKKALEDLIDISKVKINIKKNQAYVYYDNTIDDILITATIEKLGCMVTGIKEEN